jgi:hypothetical protein
VSTPPEIDELASSIARAHPFARVEIDAPLIAEGTYCVDVRIGDRLVTVEWNAAHGYGISLIVEAALDAGPDVRAQTLEEVLKHVAAYLRPATCQIVDDTGKFSCIKAWGHEEPTHTGMRRVDDIGHGKSWIADDEEHLRRLTITGRS